MSPGPTFDSEFNQPKGEASMCETTIHPSDTRFLCEISAPTKDASQKEKLRKEIKEILIQNGFRVRTIPVL